MSNPIAVYSGSTVIYWSAIVITLGLLASLLMTLGLQRSDRNPGFLVFLLLPLTVIFSVPPVTVSNFQFSLIERLSEDTTNCLSLLRSTFSEKATVSPATKLSRYFFPAQPIFTRYTSYLPPET